MHKILRDILNFILPPRCIDCGKILFEDDGLCETCFNEINFISHPYCVKCGNPFEEVSIGKSMVCGNCVKGKSPVFRLSRSAMVYDDKSKNMVLGFKFFDKTENAKVFARWLKMAFKDIEKQGIDVIIPVPLHYTRMVKRRYNQAALMVKELAKISNIKTDYTSLARNIRTKPQVEFSGRARVRNVQGAFVVKNASKIKGKRVVLVDDVLTTGSTLKECAKALKKAGAKSVDFLTLSRVV